jgi:hypothetical protein
LTNTFTRVGWWLPAPAASAPWYREETLKEGIEGWEILVRFDQRCA